MYDNNIVEYLGFLFLPNVFPIVRPWTLTLHEADEAFSANFLKWYSNKHKADIHSLIRNSRESFH